MSFFLSLAALYASANAASFRTVGSSGCTAQMAFLPPFTDTIVFLDNYHENYGGAGVDLATGAHSKDAFMQDDGSSLYAFGVEYSWRTNTLRKLHPKSNTFCAAGAFFPDGTMVNVAGAEGQGGSTDGTQLLDGRQALRRYKPGPCDGACGMDFDVDNDALQSTRWYPSAITLGTGDVVVVGGSTMGGLVVNEDDINNPTYELIKHDGSAAPKQVELDILKFDASQNQKGEYSYNLYPHLHLLPDPTSRSRVFTLAGSRVAIHDYLTDHRIKDLPNVPVGPRCFPSSATVVLLPLTPPSYDPTILVCGGSSTDAPDPKALDDCHRIQPNDANPTWDADDRLPNGPQTMTDALLLPDGHILFLNGAHKGSAGGFMADDPVTQPLLYNPTAEPGHRFTTPDARTPIPRLYHAVAQLLPTGEILLAGSNPAVSYDAVGNAPNLNKLYPHFLNHGHLAFLNQQQSPTSHYPTEYRVELFRPDYLDHAAGRPVIASAPDAIKYAADFQIRVAQTSTGDTKVRLSYSGFRTHAMEMGQRMVELEVTLGGHGARPSV
ncbi:Carbohydrate-binding module family 18 protein [Teratosphaeria destructans]|uniref:Carbohydrate-binding module family 18 protein n=1 Tax=Teratosphaeria destructans TaxID=418781 RepID=A0A9W7SZI6_9PEZI|nr:Carbohydrate-binding module family 18 protein [Teratosphaeria destructans]